MFRYILPLSLITPICIASNQQSLAPATAPVPELLGRWEDAPGLTTIELEVGPGAMFPTITAALTAAPMAGLGVVPVTINIQPGTYNEANGEVFPFVIPAHGITLEGTDLNGGEVFIERNQNNGTNAMVLMNSLGNESLPPSVVRGLGLKYRYMDASGTAASIRIEVGNPGRNQARVMPEIRDCRIGGDYSRGIEIFSQPKTIVEPVIERNEIISSDPEPWDGQVGILVDGWPYAASTVPPAAEIPLTSPYIRSNRVSNFKKNISVEGGDFHNRPRVWSNFIHDGGINLAIESCAPYVNSNTIAFGNVAGTRWSSIKELYFLNNCIWNPGFTDVDVVGGILPGGGSLVLFNFDEDSTLAAAPLSPQYLVNFAYMQPQYSSNITTSPQFVSGDVFNARTLNRNLHITASSPLIDIGGYDLTYSGFIPTVQVVGSGSNSRTVRTDCAYDYDFQSRIITGSNSHACDIGADETDPFELVLGAMTLTSSGIPAMDRVGNLRHNPLTNTWETEIVVQSNVQGLFTMIFAGTGNMTQLALPNTPVLENGPVYQHLSGMNLLPGVLENEIGLDFYTSNCMFQVAAGTTGNPIHLALPAYNSIYAEAEIQLCAVTLVQLYPPTATDSGLRFVVSNRIDLELN